MLALLRTIVFRRRAVFGVPFAADPVGQRAAPACGAVDSRALLRLFNILGPDSIGTI